MNTPFLSKNTSTIVNDCTDSLELLSQVNTDLEQNRHDHIAYCQDNQYHALRKNIPTDSEFLFGDDLPKRMLLQIKSSFLHLKLLFNHITPLSKVQKTSADSQNRTSQPQKQYSNNHCNKYPKQKKH